MSVPPAPAGSAPAAPASGAPATPAGSAPATPTSSAPSAPAGGAGGPGEACPLCRAPLRAEQDWCLRCGAAARTRLAAPPKWKALVAALAVVAAVSIAVLAVALVKLAG